MKYTSTFSDWILESESNNSPEEINAYFANLLILASLNFTCTGYTNMKEWKSDITWRDQDLDDRKPYSVNANSKVFVYDTWPGDGYRGKEYTFKSMFAGGAPDATLHFYFLIDLEKNFSLETSEFKTDNSPIVEIPASITKAFEMTKKKFPEYTHLYRGIIAGKKYGF
jgi:hypothetical protein